ncbi:MAG TPA: hypothetical protein VFU22_08185 [Roseiflexaceae bacterium]|nr:hypothetical protein [Roseiflexaceae bacterium]
MSCNEELKIACRVWGARADVQARLGPAAADVLIDIGDAARAAAELRGAAQREDAEAGRLTDLLFARIYAEGGMPPVHPYPDGRERLRPANTLTWHSYAAIEQALQDVEAGRTPSPEVQEQMRQRAASGPRRASRRRGNDQGDRPPRAWDALVRAALDDPGVLERANGHDGLAGRPDDIARRTLNRVAAVARLPGGADLAGHAPPEGGYL